MLLSIVFSFRNEQEVIPELIKRLRQTLDPLKLDYELIFVNDASDDGSLEVLLKYHKEDSRVKIINLSRRFGLAPGILAGLQHARGDAVIYMDADLQDPPELIPKLLEEFKKGAEVVHTTRTKRRGESRLKMWLTRQAYKTINLVADIDIPQDTGDFKLLSRRAVDELLRLREYDPFMRGLVRWIGFKQTQVFYERQPRYAGRTHFSLLRSINPIREFVRGLTSFSELPLYLAIIMCLLSWAAGLVYLAVIIVGKLFFGLHVSSESAMIIIMLILTGAVLFAIGILGLYVGRIHYDVKNRPHYIIESKIGFDDDDKSNID